MNNKIKYLTNHDPKEAIADIVDSEGRFKFRDNVSKKDRDIILNWIQNQGVQIK